MNEVRYKHAAVSVKEGILYVFGGSGLRNGTYVSSIERFTAATNSWETIKTDLELPERMWLGAVEIVGSDEVVIFSGHWKHHLYYDVGGPRSDVHVFHTDSNRLEKRGDIVACVPAFYPVTYDQKNSSIFFGDYESDTLFSIKLPTCNVTEILKLGFEAPKP